MNPICRDMSTTIFEAMSMRARETGAINLGQGFPDGPSNDAVNNAACDALQNRSNQYPPMVGLPEPGQLSHHRLVGSSGGTFGQPGNSAVCRA